MFKMLYNLQTRYRHRQVLIIPTNSDSVYHEAGEVTLAVCCRGNHMRTLLSH